MYSAKPIVYIEQPTEIQLHDTRTSQGPRAYKLSKRNPGRNLWNSGKSRSYNDDALSEVPLSLSPVSLCVVFLSLSLLLYPGVTRYTP